MKRTIIWTTIMALAIATARLQAQNSATGLSQGSSSAFGVLKADGTGIIASGGVISLNGDSGPPTSGYFYGYTTGGGFGYYAAPASGSGGGGASALLPVTFTNSAGVPMLWISATGVETISNTLVFTNATGTNTLSANGQSNVNSGATVYSFGAASTVNMTTANATNINSTTAVVGTADLNTVNIGTVGTVTNGALIPTYFPDLHGGAAGIGTSTVGANVESFASFSVAWPTYVTNVCFNIALPYSGGLCGVAIYTAAPIQGVAALTKILDTGPLSTTSANNFNVSMTNSGGTVGATLQPGAYYVGWNADNGTVQFGAIVGVATNGALLNLNTYLPFTGTAGAATAGESPATLGTLTTINNMHQLWGVFQ